MAFFSKSWIQGGAFIGFFGFKAVWNFLLAIFHIFGEFFESPLNPLPDTVKKIYSSYLNVTGAFVFFTSLVIALLIGTLIGIGSGLWYLMVSRKIRNLIKTYSKRATENNNDNENNQTNEENSENEGPKEEKLGSPTNNNNMAVVKTGNRNLRFFSKFFECCCSYFFGKNTFGNIELRIGLQMIVNDKYIDPDALEVFFNPFFFND